MDIIEVLTNNGYNQEAYGYKKVTKHNTHWITLFKDGGLQMYAYFTEDEDCDKIYDTGILDNPSTTALQTLIDVLITNNK